MNDLSQGLAVSITGLTITFIALGVFIGVMYLLQWMFPYKPEAEEEQGKANGEEAQDEEAKEEIAEAPVAKEDMEVAAAVAVAVQYFLSKNYGNLGESLEQGRGQWWHVNRLSARQISGIRMNRSN